MAIMDAYPKDQALMESLGLRTGGYGRDWNDLGTVVRDKGNPHGEYGPKPPTTIKVEVAALPAKFWRFTVTRPRDAAETLPDGTVRGVYEPVEVRVITTGSGAFTDYWPTVELIADHMLDVEAR